jgi:hypothetical protein
VDRGPGQQHPDAGGPISVIERTSDDISYHTARMLLDLVRQLGPKHPRDKTVRVGFAGGAAEGVVFEDKLPAARKAQVLSTAP